MDYLFKISFLKVFGQFEKSVTVVEKLHHPVPYRTEIRLAGSPLKGFLCSRGVLTLQNCELVLSSPLPLLRYMIRFV